MINAYKIGVSIALSSNADAVLGHMLSRLMGAGAATDVLKSKLDGMRGAALAAVGAFAGFAGISAVAKVIGDARELNDQLERTKQLGGEFASTLGAQKANDFRVASLVGSITPAQAQRLTIELGSTLGHPGPAMDMLDKAARAAAVISHFTHENQEDIIKNLVRVADDRAQIFTKDNFGREVVDQSKLAIELEAAARGLIIGGGFIKSNDLLQEARQAGPAAKTQSAESYYTAMTELAIEMGAPKAGTANMGLFQEFIGGTMTKKVAEHLTEAGFLKSADWHSGRNGGVVVNPGVAGRYSGMTEDPAAYFSTGDGAAKIQAYASKEGITAMQAVMQLFGRQTVDRLVSDFMTNRPQIERARSMANAIPNVSAQYDELQKNDLDTNILSFQNSWTGLMQALGEAGVPAAIGVMHGLTGGLHAITEVLMARPWVGPVLLGVATGLSALLAVGGSVTVISFALGSTGLATAIGALAKGVTPFGPGGAGTAAITGAETGLGRLVSAIGPLGLAAGLAALAVGYLGSKINQEGQGGHFRYDPMSKRTSFVPDGQDAASAAANAPTAPAARSYSPALRGRYAPPPGTTSAEPLHVTVTNTGDIARGANAYTTRQLAKPDTGPTGGDLRDSNAFGGFGAGP